MTRRGSGVGAWRLAWVVLAACAGCGSTGLKAGGAGASASMPDIPDALIQMRRNVCAADPGPVYSISIFSDGTFVYDGRANVGIVGLRRGKISAEDLSQLITTLDAMHFLDMPAAGCVCSAKTGRQIVTLDYRPGSVQKTVVHDTGCWSAPPAMAVLEQSIDRSTGAEKWIAQPAAGQASVASSTAPAP